MPLPLVRQIFNLIHAVPAEVLARFADESLCRRCGRCCHAAIRVQGRFVLLVDLPCRHLEKFGDGRTRCRLYVRREQTGFCNKLSEESVRRNLFPPDCPYMQGIPYYSGKLTPSAAEFQALLPRLREIFRDYPRPEAIAGRDWERFIHEVLGLPRPGR